MANFFTEHYVDTLKHHYFDYKGRAPAKKFGFYMLSHLLVVIGFAIIAAVAMRLLNPSLVDTVGASLLGLWALLTLSPTLCLLIRRLHDAGLSGWFVLLILFIGPLLNMAGLVGAGNGVGFGIIGALCVIKGQPKDNKYGPPTSL